MIRERGAWNEPVGEELAGPYFVVGYEDYYPSGWQQDIRAGCDTEEEAIEYANGLRCDTVEVWRIDGVSLRRVKAVRT